MIVEKIIIMGTHQKKMDLLSLGPAIRAQKCFNFFCEVYKDFVNGRLDLSRKAF